MLVETVMEMWMLALFDQADEELVIVLNQAALT